MRIAAILMCSILLTSCFEVVEEWNVNTDGSGSWTLSLNASKSRTELDAISLLDSFRGYPVPNKDRLLSRVNELVDRFNQTDSVKAQIVQVDTAFYIVDLKVSFQSVTALNRAIHHLHGDDSVRTEIGYNHHQFGRSISVADSRPYKRLEKVDFKGSVYTRICRFKQPIGIPPDGVRVSPDRKACMYQSPVNSIIQQPEILNFIINLKS